MNLTFVNETTGAELEAAVDTSTTADEIISNLIAANVIAAPGPNEQWNLFSPGKAKVSGSMTVGEGGFTDGERISLVTTMTA